MGRNTWKVAQVEKFLLDVITEIINTRKYSPLTLQNVDEEEGGLQEADGHIIHFGSAHDPTPLESFYHYIVSVSIKII